MSKALDLPLNCWRFSLARAPSSVPIAQLTADHPLPPPLSRIAADKWPAGGRRICLDIMGGWGGERSQPLRPAASAPSLLGSWPQKLAGLEGTRGRDGDSAPGTLTRGPALHAPAAARGHRAPRAAPSRPSSPGHPPGHCSEHPPRSPPSVALYGSFKAAAATRAAAAFDGDKAAKAAGEAPARPALARPCPPPPAPREPRAWPRSAAERPAGTPRAPEQTFTTGGRARRTPLTFAAASFPALAPDPPTDRLGGKQLPSPKPRLGRRGEGERRRKRKGGQFLVFQPPRGSSCPSRQVKSQGWGGDIS